VAPITTEADPRDRPVPAAKRDRDNDTDNNSDDGKVLAFGHAAGAADAQALVALVTSYYRAAAREDGARACSMLYPFVAESIVEGYGQQASLRGDTCAAVMRKLFRQRHSALVRDSPTLDVTAVRVDGNKALVVLTFATAPEIRQIPERRGSNGWKMLNVIDGIVE
jgi:hypothetical protein